jgi:cell division protein FtsI/penicillin-binding protein 2
MNNGSKVEIGRVRFIFFVLVFFALVLVYRLYDIQIVSGEYFSGQGDQQYLKPSSALLNRGNIYFTSKEGEFLTAAFQQTGNIVTINPNNIKDPEAIFERINSNVPIDREDFYAKANKKNDPYEEIVKRVSLETGSKIAEPKLAGLQIFRQKWRAYPFNTLASSVLGFMAYSEDELAGRYGIERQYEKTLQRANESIFANVFVEMFSNIKKTFTDSDNREGDIVLTIEPTVESYLERTLENVTKKWSSEYSAGIIMNPKTGEIIAMGSYPSFDPNNFSVEKDSKIFSNRLVEDVYEMGSIIKPLTVAAGIDSGAITADSTYYDAGYLVLNNRRISNYDGRGRGQVAMQEVLSQSLNTGVAHIVKEMTNEKFAEYMRNFGLDKKTNIDLPFEAAPLVENLNSPRDIEHATASYGQGIAMTPIATIRALSVLANEGKLPQPYIVSKINYKTGLKKSFEHESSSVQVLKPQTAEDVTRMLVEVVDNALLGGTVKLKNYSVAAKTGTAQVSMEGGGGYYDDRYLHSFFGYFPAYDPKFIIFLYTYYPKEVQYASETLTASFMDLTKYLINYYDIPPDR